MQVSYSKTQFHINNSNRRVIASQSHTTSSSHIQLGQVPSRILKLQRREVLLMFSKNAGVRDSNEAEILTILKAFRLFYICYTGVLMVENGFSNVVRWVLSRKAILQKSHFHFNEVRKLQPISVCPSIARLDLQILFRISQMSEGLRDYLLGWVQFCNQSWVWHNTLVSLPSSLLVFGFSIFVFGIFLNRVFSLLVKKVVK